MRRLLFVLACLSVAPMAHAQTLAERATLAVSPTFVARVQIAAMQTALTVAVEADTVPQHAARLKFATWVMKEPVGAATRLAVMVASVPSVSDTVTDAALGTLMTNNWTLLATMFAGG